MKVFMLHSAFHFDSGLWAGRAPSGGATPRHLNDRSVALTERQMVVLPYGRRLNIFECRWRHDTEAVRLIFNKCSLSFISFLRLRHCCCAAQNLHVLHGTFIRIIQNPRTITRISSRWPTWSSEHKYILL